MLRYRDSPTGFKNLTEMNRGGIVISGSFRFPDLYRDSVHRLSTYQELLLNKLKLPLNEMIHIYGVVHRLELELLFCHYFFRPHIFNGGGKS